MNKEKTPERVKNIQMPGRKIKVIKYNEMNTML